MNTDDIQAVENACGAAGYTPVGATTRERLEDGCAYVHANEAPEGESGLWEAALAACDVIDAFFVGR